MTFLTVTMDDDNDMTTNVGGSRTALPKFNHLYPILFFSQFIRFCGANKCGGPLSSPDGRIESIVTLEDSQAQAEAEMPSPSRAAVAADGTPQPRGRGRGARHQSPRPPRPADVTDEEFRAAQNDARDRKKRAQRMVEDCRAIAGHLAQAVAGDPVGQVIVDDTLGFNGIDGPKAFKKLWTDAGPSKMMPMLKAKFLKFKQGGLSMAKFIATMNSYFKYLTAAGSTYSDGDKLDEMLTRVNAESLVFATQIRETCNDSWARVCAKLTQTSEILRIRAVLDGGAADVDAGAGAMRATPTTTDKCAHCGRKGHDARECINAPGPTPEQKNARFEKFKAAKIARGEWKNLDRGARARCGMIDPDDEDSLVQYYDELDNATSATARSARVSTAAGDALDSATARSARTATVASHAPASACTRTGFDDCIDQHVLDDDDGSVVGSEDEFEARRAVSTSGAAPAPPASARSRLISRSTLVRVAYVFGIIAAIAGAMALPVADAAVRSNVPACTAPSSPSSVQDAAVCRASANRAPCAIAPSAPPLPSWASEYAAPHGAVAKVVGASARQAARGNGKLVYDGGATHHFLKTMEHFTDDFRHFDDDKLSVKVASGAKVQMVGCGTAIIPVANDRGEEVRMHLHNAVYVPGFAESLISMPQLYDAGAQSNFDPGCGAKLVARRHCSVFNGRHTVVPIKYEGKTFSFPVVGDALPRARPPKARRVAGSRRHGPKRVCVQAAPQDAWFAEHAFDAADDVVRHDASFDAANAMRTEPTSPRSVQDLFVTTARCTGTGQAAAAVARDAFCTPPPQSPPQEPSVSPGGEAQHRSARGPTRAPLAQDVIVDQPTDSAQSTASTGAEKCIGSTCSVDERAQYLHELFVHARFDDVKGTLKKGSATTSVDKVPHKHTCSCRGCLLAKATRAPRSKRKRTPTSRPLEFLDIDYFEVKDPSFSGCRTAMTITCRHTKFRWSFLLASKKLGPSVFANFMKERRAEGLVTGRVTVQGDNAMLSRQFRAACRDSRVKVQSCAPHAHWQNGIAERGFRTLAESTKAVLFEKRLPKSFWGLAFLHCTHVLNGVGRSRSDHVSPHEALHGQPFNAEHLLPFGTLVVVHQEVAGKLDPKGRPGIYVGESAHHAKGTVSVFMPDTKRVVHSNSFRVVHFEKSDNKPTMHKWRTLVNGHDNQWPIVAETAPVSAAPWTPSTGTLPLFFHGGETGIAGAATLPTSSDQGGNNDEAVERMLQLTPQSADDLDDVTATPHELGPEKGNSGPDTATLIRQPLLDKYGGIDIPSGARRTASMSHASRVATIQPPRKWSPTF